MLPLPEDRSLDGFRALYQHGNARDRTKDTLLGVLTFRKDGHRVLQIPRDSSDLDVPWQVMKFSPWGVGTGTSKVMDHIRSQYYESTTEFERQHES